MDAFVFAGQGAEEPGMGLSFAQAELARASTVTGVDLVRVLRRGGRAMGRTEVLQPALVAVGFAAARLAYERGSRPRWALGHSLGELTAAAWAFGLDVDEALRLASVRGRAMAECAAASPGGMRALACSVDASTLPPPLSLAAVNAPEETVISGPEPELDAFCSGLASAVTRLRVAGPWHSPAMHAAVAPLLDAAREAFSGGTEPRAGFYSTSAPGPVSREDAPARIAEALVAPVRFLEAARLLAAGGVERFVLLEPARTSRSMLRRCLGPRATLVTGEP